MNDLYCYREEILALVISPAVLIVVLVAYRAFCVYRAKRIARRDFPRAKARKQ